MFKFAFVLVSCSERGGSWSEKGLVSSSVNNWLDEVCWLTDEAGGGEVMVQSGVEGAFGLNSKSKGTLLLKTGCANISLFSGREEI